MNFLFFFLKKIKNFLTCENHKLFNNIKLFIG